MGGHSSRRENPQEKIAALEERANELKRRQERKPQLKGKRAKGEAVSSSKR